MKLTLYEQREQARQMMIAGKTIKRGDVFAEGEYYVCCEVWIMNSKSAQPKR